MIRLVELNHWTVPMRTANVAERSISWAVIRPIIDNPSSIVAVNVQSVSRPIRRHERNR
jgi:hypothetical protein